MFCCNNEDCCKVTCIKAVSADSQSEYVSSYKFAASVCNNIVLFGLCIKKIIINKIMYHSSSDRIKRPILISLFFYSCVVCVQRLLSLLCCVWWLGSRERESTYTSLSFLFLSIIRLDSVNYNSIFYQRRQTVVSRTGESPINMGFEHACS